LHTGAIMVTVEDTRVIDPEFAFIGPIGFDVGAVIGNLLLAFFAQEGREAAPDARDAYRDWIPIQAEKVWSGFHRRFLEFWRAAPAGDAYPASLVQSDEDRVLMEKERARFMRVLFEDSLAFAGAKMIRRILGLAHVEDLEAIADPERPACCEAKALRLARQLLICPKDFSGLADVANAARTVGRA
jgi:5-methylthioribose kinase